MSVTTNYTFKNGTSTVDIGTVFCDLTNTQTVAGAKTFSTTPIVGTMATSDSSTSAASTAYVKNQAYATLASPTFTGTVTVPQIALSTTGNIAATADFVIGKVPSLTAYAPLASPTFTGNVNIGTVDSTSNGQFLLGSASISTGIGKGEIYFIDSAKVTHGHIFSQGGIYVDTTQFCVRSMTSGSLTGTNNILAYGSTTALGGTVTAPTPASTSNDTTVATTAFVKAAITASAAPDLTPYALKTDGNYGGIAANPYGIMPLKYTLIGHTEGSQNLIALAAGNAYMYFGYNNYGNFFGYCNYNSANQLVSGSPGITCGSGTINNGHASGILRVYKIEVTLYNF